jgi:hypothetical protein
MIVEPGNPSPRVSSPAQETGDPILPAALLSEQHSGSPTVAEHVAAGALDCGLSGPR